jgi:hypothetical protein
MFTPTETSADSFWLRTLDAFHAGKLLNTLRSEKINQHSLALPSFYQSGADSWSLRLDITNGRNPLRLGRASSLGEYIMKRKISYLAGSVVLATLISGPLAAQDKSDIDRTR